MSVENVKKHFNAHCLQSLIKELNSSTATVAEAAAAIGCKPEEIAKSLAFMVEGKPVLIVVAGDVKIANSKFKAYFGTKAVMLKGQQVEDLIGHPIGGVCPFGLKDGVSVYLDESLKRFQVVYPACGSPNAVAKLTLDQLEELSCPLDWIDVCQVV